MTWPVKNLDAKSLMQCKERYGARPLYSFVLSNLAMTGRGPKQGIPSSLRLID